jgi:hypothetical protein
LNEDFNQKVTSVEESKNNHRKELAALTEKYD